LYNKNFWVTVYDEQKRILKALDEAHFIMYFLSVCLKGPRKTIKDLLARIGVCVAI
jgi:hypothetical protein